MIDIVKEYDCICASPMPFKTPYTIEKLKDTPRAVVTGVVSFPSGAQTSVMKASQTRELIAMGCKEIDMVTNVSAMISGEYDTYKNDISAVVHAAEGIPVKTILEICYLTKDEIRRASALAVEAGAVYIKTATGWGTRGTTQEDIRLIRDEIGSSAKIKAAGGIRDLDKLISVYEAGADRFGLGVKSARGVLEEARRRSK